MTVESCLIFFVRLALGQQQSDAIPEGMAWDAVLQLADKQGVAAIAADGIGMIAEVKMPFNVKMEWASRVIEHERVYRLHEQRMAQLARTYRKKNYCMMVLKGWGLSLNYPKPSHRPSGDLDIWNFGQWKEADAYLSALGVGIDNGHHHHSVFYVDDLMVENHYDFINVYAHRSSKRIEKKLRELAARDYVEKTVDGVTVYLPSADFNALFLLRHTAQHFAGSAMTLRQLLDWALFMEHHHAEIRWKDYSDFIKKERLWRFFNLLNLLAVEKLGFDKAMLPYNLEQDELLERVFADVVSPEFSEVIEGNDFSRMLTKARRWWCNRWKHDLCYSDSLLSDFVLGIRAKMLKPSHFLR